MLQTQNISFQYQNTPILKDIAVSLEKGELLAIVGPNGAGKSTLLSLLANEVTCKEPIIFKDKCYKKWDITHLAVHKSKFSQHFNADIPLTVEEVVLMGRYPYFDNEPKREDIEAAALAMQKTDVFKHAKREYIHLSGGEKQRVHLARVIAQLDNKIQNKMLFLDEPLNNLDVYHQHSVMQFVKDFVLQSNTATVVLHDLNIAAQYATKIALMKNGRIVKIGAPEDVFVSSVISEVYNFPCTICKNPINQNPLILFGN